MYGPYTRKDGREHVVLKLDNGTLKTVSYPKFLIEQCIGRKLRKNETVHHKNGNVTDNRLENLQILDRSTHTKKDVFVFINKKVQCIWCTKEFEMGVSQRNNKKAGPFCSRKCSGQYGAAVQNGNYERLGPKEVDRKYLRERDGQVKRV
jgi:hypothetical protein